MGESVDKRGAGVLLHPASLPGKGPIGDFGIEAYRFVDFLAATNQSYWQLLPLNQIDGGKAYSPYSPLSAFAGNVLFIDPDRVSNVPFPVRHRWKLRTGRKIDYQLAERIKTGQLREISSHFIRFATEEEKEKFRRFCDEEHYWLYDYSVFIVLKRYFDGRAWNDWTPEYRDRDPGALEKFITENREEIEHEKYYQYLFLKQWLKLKRYANKKGISVIGDIPIYTSYDSADVWAHPHYFLLDKRKSMLKVAGVPPDYFNDEGQLWNMPIYDWEALRRKGYEWWIERLKKNLQLYDMVRLDHFRGFSAFWEIDAGADTARNGHWRSGPGHAFFETVRHHFPHMPFAAEDLGDIDQAVYDLRDAFHLPGMSVLQFAFGDDFPDSVHLPHNYTKNTLVYTGTHDNNTARGWYSRDANRAAKHRARHYLGKGVNRFTIHRAMIRAAYASVGKIAIVPMQDILGKGNRARMNFPSTVKGNWEWRMRASRPGKRMMRFIMRSVTYYGR